MTGHPWFAAVYDRLNAAAERGFLRPVREETAGKARGRVLEIGCGTGASFSYYREGALVTATEPDPYMLERARRRAAECGRPMELREAPAEALPFADGSFDTVVSTLVLCTVADPVRALAEIRRVLVPGGEYRFYEHVRWDHAFGAFWQDVVTPGWRWCFAGCHPNRDLERVIRDSGLAVMELRENRPLPPVPPLWFVGRHLGGVARAA